MLACLQNSRVKGHHAFSFVCEIERSNAYSDVAIVVKRGSQVIGDVPERLARILTPMLDDGHLRKIDGWIAGPERPRQKVSGRGIEFLCCYVLHGLKKAERASESVFMILPVKRTLLETDP